MLHCVPMGFYHVTNMLLQGETHQGLDNVVHYLCMWLKSWGKMLPDCSKSLSWSYMGRNSSGSAGTKWILMHLWPFLFMRSQYIDQLLMNDPAGKFPFNQRLQPISVSSKESSCKTTMRWQGGMDEGIRSVFVHLTCWLNVQIWSMYGQL